MKQNILIFIDFIKQLYNRRSMIWTMSISNLKARYIGSLFGFVWAVIEPLSQLAIYGIVFGMFFKSKPDPVFGTDSFFLFLLCGLIPWLFFVQTINTSSYTLASNKNLIKKAVGFPSEILPIIEVVSNTINHMIGIGLLLLIMIIFTGSINPYSLYIFVYLFFMVIFCIGLGWITSSIYVYLKDIQVVVRLILTGWLFFTPIFYSPNIVPEAILPIYKLNPMYHVVIGYKYALLAGKLLPMWDLAYLSGISLFTFAIGGLLFRRLKPGFAEVL